MAGSFLVLEITHANQARQQAKRSRSTAIFDLAPLDLSGEAFVEACRVAPSASWSWHSFGRSSLTHRLRQQHPGIHAPGRDPECDHPADRHGEVLLATQSACSCLHVDWRLVAIKQSGGEQIAASGIRTASADRTTPGARGCADPDHLMAAHEIAARNGD